MNPLFCNPDMAGRETDDRPVGWRSSVGVSSWYQAYELSLLSLLWRLLLGSPQFQIARSLSSRPDTQ